MPARLTSSSSTLSLLPPDLLRGSTYLLRKQSFGAGPPRAAERGLPDRSLLQAVFSPQEPLAAVAAELRAALAADAQRPFFLYTTPPTTRLTDER
jgi:hypothetical protein